MNQRIGQGYDIHRLQAGGKLVICGVVVSTEVSPIAHSDGDVAIHAIVDAMLGAMGWGDIGERFPNSDPRWKGASSRLFLESVYKDVVRAGYVLGNLDVTILLEKPKLSKHKSEMGQVLAQTMNLPAARINIKAGTNEGCDAVGRGEAVAAHAVVILSLADERTPGVKTRATDFSERSV